MGNVRRHRGEERKVVEKDINMTFIKENDLINNKCSKFLLFGRNKVVDCAQYAHNVGMMSTQDAARFLGDFFADHCQTLEAQFPLRQVCV